MIKWLNYLGVFCAYLFRNIKAIKKKTLKCKFTLPDSSLWCSITNKSLTASFLETGVLVCH